MNAVTSTDITIPVPTDRVPEFYQFFGLWLSGSLQAHPRPGPQANGAPSTSEVDGEEVVPWGNTESDLEDATRLWRKFSPNARAMFSLLIDKPGEDFTGEQIAEAIGIPKGSHGVAGVLAWPGRYGYKIGRGLPSEYFIDPDTYEGFYSMSEERASLFRAARERAEASA